MGHTVSQSTREKIRLSVQKLAVVQYTLAGEPVKTFPSITAAASSVNLHKSTICAVCRGRKQTAKGFIWRYAVSKNFDAECTG